MKGIIEELKFNRNNRDSLKERIKSLETNLRESEEEWKEIITRNLESGAEALKDRNTTFYNGGHDEYKEDSRVIKIYEENNGFPNIQEALEKKYNEARARQEKRIIQVGALLIDHGDHTNVYLSAYFNEKKIGLTGNLVDYVEETIKNHKAEDNKGTMCYKVNDNCKNIYNLLKRRRPKEFSEAGIEFVVIETESLNYNKEAKPRVKKAEIKDVLDISSRDKDEPSQKEKRFTREEAADVWINETKKRFGEDYDTSKFKRYLSIKIYQGLIVEEKEKNGDRYISEKELDRYMTRYFGRIIIRKLDQNKVIEREEVSNILKIDDGNISQYVSESKLAETSEGKITARSLKSFIETHKYTLEGWKENKEKSTFPLGANFPL